MNKKYIHIYRTALVAYILILGFLTLFYDQFGRDISNIAAWGSANANELLKEHINLSPFSTIKLMINGINHGNVTFWYFTKNVLGNILMLSPFAFLIPKVFIKINRFWKFMIIAVLLSVCIELLQLLFLTGCCDIDDLILNTLGAAIFYPIFNIKNSKKNNGGMLYE